MGSYRGCPISDPQRSHPCPGRGPPDEIAAKSPGKTEHDVEKADPVFAGLAVEYLLDGTAGDDVTVLTADRVACEAIETAMASLDYANQITILAVWDIIDDVDDDLTFI